MTITCQLKGYYKLCACGCGSLIKIVNWGRPCNFKSHHYRKPNPVCRYINNDVKCACGCGLLTNIRRGIISKFRPGHQNKGERHPFWKGGIKHHEHGYLYIWNPNHPHSNSQGYVAEHRLTMEKHLGRYLTKDEVIHHINGVTNDNRIENLQLLPNNSVHSILHMKGNKYGVQNKGDRICLNCNSKTTHKTKTNYEVWGKDKNGNWLCSKCYGAFRRYIHNKTGSWSTK